MDGVTISKADMSLLLGVLSVLLALGLGAYAVVAAVAFLLGRLSLGRDVRRPPSSRRGRGEAP